MSWLKWIKTGERKNYVWKHNILNKHIIIAWERLRAGCCFFTFVSFLRYFWGSHEYLILLFTILQIQIMETVMRCNFWIKSACFALHSDSEECCRVAGVCRHVQCRAAETFLSPVYCAQHGCPAGVKVRIRITNPMCIWMDVKQIDSEDFRLSFWLSLFIATKVGRPIEHCEHNASIN